MKPYPLAASVIIIELSSLVDEITASAGRSLGLPELSCPMSVFTTPPKFGSTYVLPGPGGLKAPPGLTFVMAHRSRSAGGYAVSVECEQFVIDPLGVLKVGIVAATTVSVMLTV